MTTDDSTESSLDTMPKTNDSGEAPKASQKVDRLIVRPVGSLEISAIWREVATCVLGGLPDEYRTTKSLTNLMGAFYDGRFQFFAGSIATESATEKPQLVVGCTTTVKVDPFTKRRTLFIVSLYATPSVLITLEAWKGTMTFLESYARQQGCTRIEAYTTNPRVMQMAAECGLKPTWRVVAKEIE